MIELMKYSPSPTPNEESLSSQDPNVSECNLEPSVWFSSLWTLQEALLCPNMMLYSRDWSTLEDGTGKPITLINLMTIFHLAFSGDGIFALKGHAMNPLCNTQEPESGLTVKNTPAGVQQLSEFADMTRFGNPLLSSSPVSTIFNANIRRCTGNRALAIMSAIDVTDWYVQLLWEKGPHEKLEKDLIYWTDPLSFLQEAFRKSGAAFVETVFVTSRDRLQRRLTRRLTRKTPIGSVGDNPLKHTRGTGHNGLYSAICLRERERERMMKPKKGLNTKAC
ncbi:hypothetical protein F4810DRAFT_407065 [Camillea tinctor]|nr:hypothetical protein F4810DRAFT_407065 [Camillea tinctor]